MERQGQQPVALDLRVRYAETDAMGVVYYANYLVWFELGRTEWIRAHGVTYRQFEDQGVLLPAVHASCDYKNSARYDDLVTGKEEPIDLTGVTVSNNGIELQDREFVAAIRANDTFAFKAKLRAARMLLVDRELRGRGVRLFTSFPTGLPTVEGDRFPWQIKAAILHTLGLLIRWVGKGVWSVVCLVWCPEWLGGGRWAVVTACVCVCARGAQSAEVWWGWRRQLVKP